MKSENKVNKKPNAQKINKNNFLLDVLTHKLNKKKFNKTYMT